MLDYLTISQQRLILSATAEQTMTHEEAEVILRADYTLSIVQAMMDGDLSDIPTTN